MTSPDVEAMLINTIADGYEIDLHWITQNRELAPERLKRIPVHFADAVASEPGVATWVRDVVARACATARAFNPRITTGPSLMLFGPVGTGKTHQAYGAIRTIALAGVALRWELITSADLFAQMRPRDRSNPEDVFERYATTSLLVLDDLGAAKGSEWTEEVLYRLINHRYQHESPTVITTNLEPPLLREALGDRVASRLREMSHQVSLKGNDRRRPLRTVS